MGLSVQNDSVLLAELRPWNNLSCGRNKTEELDIWCLAIVAALGEGPLHICYSTLSLHSSSLTIQPCKRGCFASSSLLLLSQVKEHPASPPSGDGDLLVDAGDFLEC